MTDAAYRHYIMIIDRSGSMGTIREETEHGIRYYARKMLADLGPGERGTLSLYQFDTVHDTVLSFGPLEDAEHYHLEPRGQTALLDGAGFAITAEGEALAAMPEDQRPGKVAATIASDGKENASSTWTKAALGDLITQQQETYGWQFTFLGANQDAFAEAGGIGVPHRSVLNYTAATTGAAWNAATASAGRYSRGETHNVAFTGTEVAAAAGEGETA